MISVSLAWVAMAVNGELRGASNPQQVINKVSTDTRDALDSTLFIALKGEQFDAHDFISQALAQGAIAVITQQPLDEQTPHILVEDTRYTLGLLGAAVKAEVAPKTIAITGSNGKTTVKEMLAAIIGQRYNVLATAGNFNNDIGVPLTLLRLEAQHQYAVVELGANHAGEIAYTTSLTRPDVAILNNVSAAHVEGFGSVHGVAKAKTEIFQGLPEEGLAITPYESEYLPCWRNVRAGKRLQTFGLSEQADVRASQIELNSLGQPTFKLSINDQHWTVSLQLSGLHNVKNALAASAAALEVGMSAEEIATGLANVAPVKGRLTPMQLTENVTVIDDTYNASVASTKAALDLLGSYQGTTIMVLGDMAELGAEARAYHEEVGDHAIQAGISKFFTLGVLSQSASEVFNGRGGKHFSSFATLVDEILQTITQRSVSEHVTVLVKGSRSSHMERVVNALQEHYESARLQGDQHAC
ncbi:UDP-N-acetylmuramoyl-tripeptide--D-alanyl-D-alanine ligase [Idiomarina sp.]|uniref:UDP-N-acetylmuramoyl-tripeptide--D-alanyl-D- alanine ligase n=1 Tax=Idiomarina sp. TaxID=1874361 RepID=UPI002589A1E1|nr:UDP-N-acetylmuramoyl-tripeptide--D-alanyl-D-alanine ligase [Idiomarina sp.]